MYKGTTPTYTLTLPEEVDLTDATNAGATCVRFKGNSGKTLSYYVASTSYGLLPNTKYKYIVVYSS